MSFGNISHSLSDVFYGRLSNSFAHSDDSSRKLGNRLSFFVRISDKKIPDTFSKTFGDFVECSPRKESFDDVENNFSRSCHNLCHQIDIGKNEFIENSLEKILYSAILRLDFGDITGFVYTFFCLTG